jgi:hypothetical protein
VESHLPDEEVSEHLKVKQGHAIARVLYISPSKSVRELQHTLVYFTPEKQIDLLTILSKHKQVAKISVEMSQMTLEQQDQWFILLTSMFCQYQVGS